MFTRVLLHKTGKREDWFIVLRVRTNSAGF